jgi:ribosomal protein L29
VTASLHERDFYGWVQQQCSALRNHDSSRLDWDGLQEELEALGRQEYRELVSRLAVLLGHLLKWQFQPERRSRSWFLSIREQRRAIARLLGQNPSLRAKVSEAMVDGFEAGIDLVLRETDLSLRSLPARSEWTLEQALDPATLCDTRGDWSDLAP